MRRITLPALVAVLVALPIALQAADWPVFRGPNANGKSYEKGINKDWSKSPPKMLWKTDMTDAGFAGPAIAKGTIYIIDHKDDKDVVRAINLKDGKDVWQYSYADADKEFFGYTHTTPTVSGGRVYAQGRQGLLNCLNAKTGKLIWSRDMYADFKVTKRPVHTYTMCPFVDGNRVIVCPGGPNAAVVAYDAKTGKTLWQGGGSDLAGYAIPEKVKINGKEQYLIFSWSYLMGMNPTDGKQLWSLEWKTFEGMNVAQPIMIGNSIFISSGYKHGCALVDITPGGPKIRWENQEMMAHFSSPILISDYLYGNGDPGHLMCIDPITGAAKWKKEGFEKGPLLFIDGVLLVFEGSTGALVMVDPSPESYKELGRFTPLGGTSWVAPIVSNGKLIVRNKGTLACFDLK